MSTTVLAQVYSAPPNNAVVVVRFSTTSSRWSSPNGETEAIRFKTSSDIHLLGIGLHGGEGKYVASSVKIYRLQGTDESKREEIANINEIRFEKITKASVTFSNPIFISANCWHTISASFSGNGTMMVLPYGTGGNDRVETNGVVFEFGNSTLSKYTNTRVGLFPEFYFESVKAKQMIEHSNAMMQSEIDKIRGELVVAIEKVDLLELENKELLAKNALVMAEKEEIREQFVQSKIVALHCSKGTLKFEEREKLAKLYICIQLENGSILYFDNTKPFELFAMKDEKRVNAHLKELEGEYDCSFKGTIGNNAYFSTVRGKLIRFFKVSFDEDGFIIEQVNELKTSELTPFENEPLYFIEESREWAVYQSHESYEKMDGEKFDISEIRLLRKYDCHYHRGILYFFRENTTPRLEKLNEKVVIVEGPILDGNLSFYTPPHSDCIYVANSDQNALLVLNTTNRGVEQRSYEPPIESTYHSIVGVHEGILTMAFEGKGVGRCLMTTKLF